MTTHASPLGSSTPIPPREVARKGASEFAELAQIIRGKGLLKRRYGYYWTKLIAAPLVVGLLLVAFILIGDTWWQMITAAVFAVVFTQIAFLGHDAAHRQIFVSGKWNDWVSMIVANLLVGMSHGWWQHKHTRHHANPNKLGADPDIELPAIAVTVEAAEKPRNPISAWLLRKQGWFFFPILSLLGISLHASSIMKLASRQRVDRRWVEITFITIRLVGFFALAFIVLSPWTAVAFLGVQLALFGFYMGMSFAPNHKGMPVVPRNVTIDFLRRQAMMSRNIRGSRFTDTALGGLNYQIEHHLFPSMPRPHLRIAAPIIAAFCKERNVPYMEVGLFASYAIVQRYINRVGLGEKDVFACPLVADRSFVGASV